jgi:enoyl-CoA hydratase/carnithine racemase
MGATAASSSPSSVADASLVTWQRHGAIGVMTLNHPSRRNVLSRAMLSALKVRIQEASADRSLKCLILAARGTAFCAGHDLGEIIGAEPAALGSLFGLCAEVMEAIRLAPQPVIGQVQGIATAAGCQLAATCDLVVAAETATFATPGVKIGLFCTTPAVALSRAVPTKKALEMLFTGEPITAAEAERVGLVNRVVPAAQLEEVARQLAERIVGYSGATLAHGKRAFYEQLALDRPEAYALASACMVENAQQPDAAEGMRAFLEKRPPRFQH